jgi:phage terminase small subunit
MNIEKPKTLRGKALKLAQEKIQEERTHKIMEALERAKANRKTLPNGMSVPPLPVENLEAVAGNVKKYIKSAESLLEYHRKRKAASEINFNPDEFEEELANRQNRLSPHQLNLLAAREANKRLREAEEMELEGDSPFVEVDFANPEKTTFPSYVGSVARKVFIDVLKMYISNSIENLLDTSTVLLYATTVEKFHTYERKFAAGIYEYTMTSPVSGMRSESPESKIHNATISSMKTLSSLLLMNPKSRGSSVKQKKEQSALESFIASRRNK